MVDKHTYEIQDTPELGPLFERVRRYYDSGGKESVKITIEVGGKTRSTQQNAYYWGVILPALVSHFKENIGDLIRWIMEALKFEITPEFIHNILKLKYLSGKSTTENTTGQQEEFHLEVRADAMTDFGVDIPEPNEPPIEHPQGNREGG